jgi:hypothetical protein
MIKGYETIVVSAEKVFTVYVVEKAIFPKFGENEIK